MNNDYNSILVKLPIQGLGEIGFQSVKVGKKKVTERKGKGREGKEAVRREGEKKRTRKSNKNMNESTGPNRYLQIDRMSHPTPPENSSFASVCEILSRIGYELDL